MPAPRVSLEALAVQHRESMMARPDGGPVCARPLSVAPDGDFDRAQTGLSLRQWYAGQALIGLVQQPGDANVMAARAFDVADAMLMHGGGVGDRRR